MSISKRIFAVLLTVLLVVSMVPVFAVSAEATEIAIAAWGDGWENWSGGPHGRDTELLVKVTDTSFDRYGFVQTYKTDEGWTCDFELTITGLTDPTETKTIHCVPGSTYNFGETWSGDGIFRFETCNAKGANQFVPVKDHWYAVELTISADGAAIYHAQYGGVDGDSYTGYKCPMEPIVYGDQYLKQYGTGFENWENGTYNPTTELLPMIIDTTGDFYATVWNYYDSEAKTWSDDIDFTVTLTNLDDETDTKTFTAAPNSVASVGDNYIFRFEICEDPINYIPALGADYKVEMTITADGSVLFSGSNADFNCGVIPYVKGEPTMESPYPQTASITEYNAMANDWEAQWADTPTLIFTVSDLQYNDADKITAAKANYEFDLIFHGNNGSTGRATGTANSFYKWSSSSTLVRFETAPNGFTPADGVKYDIEGTITDLTTGTLMYTFASTGYVFANGVEANPIGTEFTNLGSDPVFDVPTKTLTLDFYEDFAWGVEEGDEWRIIVNGTPYMVEVVPQDEDGYVASFTFPAGVAFNVGDAYTFYVETTTGDYAGQYYVPVTLTIPGTPEVKTITLGEYGGGWENWTNADATYGIITQALITLGEVEDNATTGEALWANRADFTWELVITDGTDTWTTVCAPWSFYGGGLNICRFATVEMGTPAFIPQIYTYYDVTLNLYKNGSLRYTGTVEGTYCGMVPVDQGEPCYDMPVVYPAELTVEPYTNEFTSDWEVYDGQNVLLLNIASKYLNYDEIKGAGWTFAVDFNGDTHYYTPAESAFYNFGTVDGQSKMLVRIPTGTDFVPVSGEYYDVTLAIYPANDSDYNEAHPYYFGSVSEINCDTVVKYKITWVVGTETFVVYVDEGEVPAFDGTPTIPDDDEFTYTFTGWDVTPKWAYEDATYTAQFTATPKAQFEVGDVNGDGSLSISDVSGLLNYLATGTTTGLVIDCLDVNGDGSVSISDVSTLLNMLAQ